MSIASNSALTPWPRAASAAVEGERLHVSLKDGRQISVPLDWFAFLATATDDQRQRFELDEYGAAISWDELEDSISVPSLFGLPENPPRRIQDRYVVEYRHAGRVWNAEIRDLESSTRGRTLSDAKRNAREILAMLLNLTDLDEAGIDVVDEVSAPEAVGAR
jgi:predicted RNase H-like HicB family nuclease